MENLNHLVMLSLCWILTSSMTSFIIQHSLIIGLSVGSISGIPFLIKDIPHLIIILLVLALIVYFCNIYNLNFVQLLYSQEAYLISEMLGNYIIGCIFGFAFANLIQRIRGEHEHVTNN